MGNVIGIRTITAEEWKVRRRELEQMLLAAKGQIAEAESVLADSRTVRDRIEGGLVELAEWERRSTGLPAPAEEET